MASKRPMHSDDAEVPMKKDKNSDFAPITKISEIQQGDHLAAKRGQSFHHMIVKSIHADHNMVEVIHVQKDKDNTMGVLHCQFVSFENLGDQVSRVEHHGQTILDRPTRVISRALQAVTNTKDRYPRATSAYHLAENNCEHFATWCKTGKTDINQAGVDNKGEVCCLSMEVVLCVVALGKKSLKRSSTPDVQSDGVPAKKAQKPGLTPITKINEIKAGDHLQSIADSGLYFHHMIVKEVYPEDNVLDVIEVQKTKDKNEGLLRCRIYLYEELGDQVSRVEHRSQTILAPSKVISRALQAITNTKGGYPGATSAYDLAKNNCEHFATWCKTGKEASHQSGVGCNECCSSMKGTLVSCAVGVMNKLKGSS